MLKTTDFYYNLPEELIAQTPVYPRDSSRLLCYDKSNDQICHKHFYDILDMLKAGDLLVINDTKVYPARIFAYTQNGGKVEVLLLKRLNLTKYIKNVFPLDYITPPAGQGALAIITRKDYEYKDKIAKLNDYISMQEVFAEKKVLEELGVGCQWPIGAIARMNDKELNVYSILLTKEGEILKEQNAKGSIRDAVELGGRIGRLFADYV